MRLIDVIKKIDAKIFFGILAYLKNMLIRRAKLKAFSVMKENWDTSRLSYQVYYQQDSGSLLNNLFEKYGSDKGSTQKSGEMFEWSPHTYADYYTKIFDSRRNTVKNFFECGIGTTNLDISCNMGANGRPGASLRGWRDYFKTAQIFGADIDKSILFSEDRIHTHYVDQLDPSSIKEMWDTIGDNQMDIILDDGLHTYDGGRILFENSFDQVIAGGLYIIEDVNPDSFDQFMNYFDKTELFVEYVSLNRYRDEFDTNNKMIVIHKP